MKPILPLLPTILMPPTGSTRKWAASALKTKRWAFISFPIRMVTGWRSFPPNKIVHVLFFRKILIFQKSPKRARASGIFVYVLDDGFTLPVFPGEAFYHRERDGLRETSFHSFFYTFSAVNTAAERPSSCNPLPSKGLCGWKESGRAVSSTKRHFIPLGSSGSCCQ